MSMCVSLGACIQAWCFTICNVRAWICAKGWLLFNLPLFLDDDSNLQELVDGVSTQTLWLWIKRRRIIIKKTADQNVWSAWLRIYDKRIKSVVCECVWVFCSPACLCSVCGCIQTHCALVYMQSFPLLDMKGNCSLCWRLAAGAEPSGDGR